MLIGLYLAISGKASGLADPDRILVIALAYVFGGGLGSYLISLVCGFAADIEGQSESKWSLQR